MPEGQSRARIIASGRVFYAPGAPMRAMLRGKWQALRRRGERERAERRIAAAFGKRLAPEEIRRIARAAFGWRALAAVCWTGVDCEAGGPLPPEAVALRGFFGALMQAALPGVRIATLRAPADGGEIPGSALPPAARIVHGGLGTFRIEILDGPATKQDLDDFLADTPAQYDWFSPA